MWLCDLLSDGWHEQPLNEVLEALAPNTLVQLFSLPHRGTSTHNTLSTCLRFVQLQSSFRQLLNGYVANVLKPSCDNCCCHRHNHAAMPSVRTITVAAFIIIRPHRMHRLDPTCCFAPVYWAHRWTVQKRLNRLGADSRRPK